jgi:urease accessory protein
VSIRSYGTVEPSALGALLQLSSPALPVGAYSYSQGLERAIEDGVVHDADSAGRWVGDSLRLVLGRFEAPVWLRLRMAWDAQDLEAFAAWNEIFVATRETRELRAETLQMGYSLRKLLLDLGYANPLEVESLSFPAAHAYASACWGIAPEIGLHGYLYGWLENQVTAAMKTVPLGQLTGQRLLLHLRAGVTEVVEAALQLDDDALSNQAPMLGIFSSRHEIQYSRLFRS